MTDTPPDPHHELTPDDQALIEMFAIRRPEPRIAFRGALARRLTSLDPGYGPRPQGLWLQAGLLIAGGLVLVIVGLLISAGTI